MQFILVALFKQLVFLIFYNCKGWKFYIIGANNYDNRVEESIAIMELVIIAIMELVITVKFVVDQVVIVVQQVVAVAVSKV